MSHLKPDKSVALLEDSARKESEAGEESQPNTFKWGPRSRVDSSKALYYNIRGITDATSPLEMSGMKMKENTSNLATFKIVKDKLPDNCK